MQPYAKKIARRLLELEAVRLQAKKPFTWASGRLAPIYCDNRLLLSYPEVRRELVEGFRRMAGTFGPFGQVAGVATAGIAHGALLAEALELPFLYVRAKPKAHGRQNQIEGRLLPDVPVLVVEDLISTGGSSLKAVQALRDAGAEVAGVLAIFSYGFPEADRAFEEANCAYRTLSDYSSLLEAARELAYIPAEDQSTLEDWRRDPANWSARHEQS